MREPSPAESPLTSDAATDPAAGGGRRPFGWWRQSLRLVRYRLIIPLMRSRHPPEHTARGVMVGLVWAMTPLVGIQMMLVACTWFIASRLFSWHFSLVLGLAWTWITNAFTILPFYYGYYITGQILLGHWDDLSGFDAFVALWRDTFAVETMGFWEAAWAYMVDIVAGWGLPLVVGSIPWVLVSGIGGYWLSLRVCRRHAAAREQRRVRADERRALRMGAHTSTGSSDATPH